MHDELSVAPGTVGVPPPPPLFPTHTHTSQDRSGATLTCSVTLVFFKHVFIFIFFEVFRRIIENSMRTVETDLALLKQLKYLYRVVRTCLANHFVCSTGYFLVE